ncbi:hypothetical protein [Mycobacterium sp. 1274761.0]|uniref:hypothetical protein n=1 Tax=Mycobacterium sp. 1274761.0 TaxID=1834077 RepID=UPI0012E713EE|nr:hypothetical protein [Mycobacterium sp. 1274761.0]
MATTWSSAAHNHEHYSHGPGTNEWQPFALPANWEYDLTIVRAAPQFRDWNGRITCDNGTSTTATT